MNMNSTWFGYETAHLSLCTIQIAYLTQKLLILIYLFYFQKRQFARAKSAPKPRIGFVPPVPKQKRPVQEKEEGKCKVLYKVEVKTGNVAEAETSAKVTSQRKRTNSLCVALHFLLHLQVVLQIEGKKGVMKPRTLTKKIGVQFVFRRGTLETFYIKGPDVGELRNIALEVCFGMKHVFNSVPSVAWCFSPRSTTVLSGVTVGSSSLFASPTCWPNNAGFSNATTGCRSSANNPCWGAFCEALLRIQKSEVNCCFYKSFKSLRCVMVFFV